MANEDKATRYHRLRRRASILSAALGGLFLIVLLVSGWSASLRTASAGLAGSTFLGTIAVYVLVLAVLHDLIQLPLAFYEGVTLERRYGLSTESTRRWWKDHLKGWAIGTGFGVAAALGIWSLIRWSPAQWWLAAALLFSLVVVALAQLAPVLLLPLFYEVKPLARDALAARLKTLAERAGAPVLGTFEWRLSDRTKKANAALAGLGRTRRILLSDTLLADYSDDEIEVILAHELAHHVHHDIWRAIVFETVLIALGFYVSDAVLTRLVRVVRRDGKDRRCRAAAAAADDGRRVAGADAGSQRPLAVARTARGPLRADDDRQSGRLCHGDEAARRAESGRRGAIPPRRGAFPQPSVDIRPDFSRQIL